MRGRMKMERWILGFALWLHFFFSTTNRSFHITARNILIWLYLTKTPLGQLDSQSCHKRYLCFHMIGANKNRKIQPFSLCIIYSRLGAWFVISSFQPTVFIILRSRDGSKKDSRFLSVEPFLNQKFFLIFL